MNKFLVSATLAVFSAVAVRPALADSLGCFDGLKEIWYNTYKVTDKQQTYSDMTSILDWTFEQLDHEISSQKSGGSGSIKVPLPILEEVFNFGANANFSSEANWEKKHTVKEAYYSFSESKKSEDILKVLFMRTGSAEAVAVFKACVESTEPLKVLVGGDELSEFVLNVVWSPQTGLHPATTKITKISMANARFASPQAFPVTVNPLAAASFKIKRTKVSERGFISVSTTGGTRFIDLPKFIQPAPDIRHAAKDVLASWSSWTPTGLVVRAGDTVSLAVTSGSWTISKAGFGNYKYNKGEGMPWSEFVNLDPKASTYTWVLPGVNPGALAGRIGNGNAFLVGNNKSFTSTENGELQLIINDAKEGLACSDNDGHLNVSATITTPASNESGMF